MEAAWKPDERLCRIFCTHISEEEDPHDEDKVPDFRDRWLANNAHHGIQLERRKEGDLVVLTKTKSGDREVTVVMKGDEIVLLYMHPSSVPSRIETLLDSEDSERAATLIGVNPDDCYSWEEVEKIE